MRCKSNLCRNKEILTETENMFASDGCTYNQQDQMAKVLRVLNKWKVDIWLETHKIPGLRLKTKSGTKTSDFQHKQRVKGSTLLA